MAMNKTHAKMRLFDARQANASHQTRSQSTSPHDTVQYQIATWHHMESDWLTCCDAVTPRNDEQTREPSEGWSLHGIDSYRFIPFQFHTYVPFSYTFRLPGSIYAFFFFPFPGASKKAMSGEMATQRCHLLLLDQFGSSPWDAWWVAEVIPMTFGPLRWTAPRCQFCPVEDFKKQRWMCLTMRYKQIYTLKSLKWFCNDIKKGN